MVSCLGSVYGAFNEDSPFRPDPLTRPTVNNDYVNKLRKKYNAVLIMAVVSLIIKTDL